MKHQTDEVIHNKVDVAIKLLDMLGVPDGSPVPVVFKHAMGLLREARDELATNDFMAPLAPPVIEAFPQPNRDKWLACPQPFNPFD